MRLALWLAAITACTADTSDYVIGVWRDPDDIEHVRVYELLKPT
jgi:hypothetical protein